METPSISHHAEAHARHPTAAEQAHTSTKTDGGVFTDFLQRSFGDRSSYTTMQALQALSSFTGVPQHQVIAVVSASASTLSADSPCRVGSAVRPEQLARWCAELTESLAALDAWWGDASVQFHGPYRNAKTEAAEDPAGDCECRDATSPVTRSAPPGRPSPSDSADSGAAGSAEPSAQPTRNSVTWRDGSGGAESVSPEPTAATRPSDGIERECHSRSCSCPPTQASVPPSPPSAPLSMAASVAAALLEGRSASGGGGDGVEVQHPPQRLEHGGGAGATPSERRLPSPLPVPPPFPQRAEARRPRSTTSPPPPSAAPMTTLAALDRFVQRGRTVKVCRQFVRTGSCSHGSRCLFHHPDLSASPPLPRSVAKGPLLALEGGGGAVQPHRRVWTPPHSVTMAAVSGSAYRL